MMPAPVVNPLTSDHLQQIKNALDVISIAKSQIDMAKRAGIDVSQHEQSLRDSEDKLLRIKNVYFPGM